MHWYSPCTPLTSCTMVLGANYSKICLQVWLYTMCLFPVNLQSLSAASNDRHLTGKCLQVWDLSSFPNEGSIEKWWEKGRGEMEEHLLSTSTKNACWSSCMEDEWTVNFCVMLQYVSVTLTKNETKLWTPAVIYTSVRDLYVSTDISAESGPSTEPCKLLSKPASFPLWSV